MKNLEKLRNEKHITQSELARYLSVARNTVSQWESSKRQPDILTLKKLSKYFNVSVDYLINNEQFIESAQTQPIYTEQQKKVISCVKNMTDEECRLTLAYIEGTKAGLKERNDLIKLLKG